MTLGHFKNFLLLSHTGSSPKANAAQWGYRGRRGVVDGGLPRWLFLPWWCWVGCLQTGGDGPATQGHRSMSYIRQPPYQPTTCAQVHCFIQNEWSELVFSPVL